MGFINKVDYVLISSIENIESKFIDEALSAWDNASDRLSYPAFIKSYVDSLKRDWAERTRWN